MKNSGRFVTGAAGILGAIVGVALLAQPIFAQKAFLTRLKLKHPELVEKKLANCHLCHTFPKGDEAGKDNLNVFGKELQKEPKMKLALDHPDDKDGTPHKYSEEELAAFDAAFDAVGDKDSDGDGATNAEELALGTNPGDPKSTPDKAALEKYRAEHKK